MSTRGAIGFQVDGTIKAVYNHHDSFPESLGESVASFCRNLDKVGIRRLRKNVRLLQLAEDGIEGPEALGRILDLQPPVMLEATGFMQDSLFCEYAYVVNLDEHTFDIYTGVRRHPSPTNPLGCRKNAKGYYPVARAKRFDFRKIPKDWITKVPGYEPLY